MWHKKQHSDMEMIVFQIDECGNLFFIRTIANGSLRASHFQVRCFIVSSLFFTELIKKVSNNTFLKVFLMSLKTFNKQKKYHTSCED